MIDANQFIVFKLGTENYQEFAIKINEVEEIITPRKITKLPQVAEFIEGIIDLRGEIVIVIDLRTRLDFPNNPENDSRIIIVNINNTNVGFIVDDASEVIRINADDIAKPNSQIVGIKTDFLKGIAKLEDRLILLLDHVNLLSTTEQARIEELAQDN